MGILYVIVAIILGCFVVSGSLANLFSIIGFDIGLTIKCLVARFVKSPLSLLLSILISIVLHSATIVICAYLAYCFDVITYLISFTVVSFFYFFVFNSQFFTKKYLLNAYLRKHMQHMTHDFNFCVCIGKDGQISNYDDVVELISITYKIYSGQ